MTKSIVSGEPTASIRIAAILGTDRPGNYTGHALRLMVERLATRGSVEVDLLDPADGALPFPGGQQAGGWEMELKEAVSQADGVLIATPEYHGSFSARLKLMIENLGFPSALRNKPVALLGVAAGRIGAIKSLEHLRSVCGHVGALVLPGAVSVAQVRQAFDRDGRCTDAEVERRLDQLAASFVTFLERHLCACTSSEEVARA